MLRNASSYCCIWCIIRCKISICGFLWSEEIVPHSSFEWVGVNNHQNRTHSAGEECMNHWAYTILVEIERGAPKWRAAFKQLLLTLKKKPSVSNIFGSVVEMTKLIITNSCKDSSSLPPERLCSSRCDLPLFQRRQCNWKQLTRIKPEVVTYLCGLVLSLSIWRSHTLFWYERNAFRSWKIQTCPAYSFFF